MYKYYALIHYTCNTIVLYLFMGAIFKCWTPPASITLNGGAKLFMNQIFNKFN